MIEYLAAVDQPKYLRYYPSEIPIWVLSVSYEKSFSFTRHLKKDIVHVVSELHTTTANYFSYLLKTRMITFYLPSRSDSFHATGGTDSALDNDVLTSDPLTKPT